MNLFCITPTGMRPEGMALLSEYLDAQTYAGPLTWVIVDDCDPVTRIRRPKDRSIRVEIIRPEWRWQPGMNTQCRCMAEALAFVPSDAAVAVLEDDDAYLSEHLINMTEGLELAELVGETNARYYNVSTGHWQEMRNNRHSSLCSTACRGSALALLRELCKQPRKFIDIDLWKQHKGSQMLINEHQVVGIKGLPGRPGIGAGHRTRFGKPDTTGVLQEWLGPYANNYSIFWRAA